MNGEGSVQGDGGLPQSPLAIPDLEDLVYLPAMGTRSDTGPPSPALGTGRESPLKTHQCSEDPRTLWSPTHHVVGGGN